MSGNDELRSVRVEVEDTSTRVDAPVLGRSRRQNRWPSIGGALAIVVLGVAFVVLRPAGDEAADGTVREPPPTTQASSSTTSAPSTTAPAEAVAEQSVDEREPTELSIALDAAEPGGRIDPIPVSARGRFLDVVDIDGGFVALADVAPTERPPVYGSIDGLDWIELEVPLLDADVDVDDSSAVKWRQLIPTPDGVGAIGFVVDGAATSADERIQFVVATSPDGEVWQSVDSSDVAPRGDDASERVAVPISVLGSAIISAEASDAVPLEDILRFDEVVIATPTFDSICEAYGGSANASSITECGSFSVVNELATAGSVPDELNGVGLGALDLNNSGPAFGECVAVAADLTVPGFTISGSEQDDAFAFAGTGRFPEFAVLADGRVAVVDRGTVGAVASCDAAGGSFRREGGVVLVDFDAQDAVSIQVPAELQSVLESSVSVEFLGEFVADQTRSHLLLVIAGDLWSIDTRTGRWAELAPDFVATSGFGRSQFVLSSSGSRLYRLDLDGLTAIDLSSNDDGSLSFNVANWPILPDEFLFRDVRETTFLHAEDDVLFLFDGLATWRLAVPS